ncbi:MAG TPA: D-aminoacylase [Candidatus Limnocylindrales bacterium]|nr:D-aminoacylase [Candidatus Limnocylindrales bacterium]
MTDLLITGGTIVDGTGAPGRPGTLAIEDGRLRLLPPDPTEVPHPEAGQPAQRAARHIDASGLVVAPGFIDLHSHSGLMMLADPRHEPKVRQGITTEVIGVDGLSYAPFTRTEDLEALVEMNAGLDGRPDIAYDWDRVARYLERFDRQVAVNVAFLVGNSALRICALGWDDVPADQQALDRMQAYLREAMTEGAFGLSSGLDYPPGAYATTEELATLAGEAARQGGFYHTHVRYQLGDRFLDPFREAIEIGRRGECPAHITHFYHRRTFPGGPEQLLGLVDDARAEGLDVTFDTYPYEWASTRLLIMLPIWLQEGGPGPTKERLADPAVRDRLRAEITARGEAYAGKGLWADLRLGYFARSENRRWEGRTMAELVAETGTDPVDALCDLLLAEGLRVNQVTPGPWRETLPHFVRHPVGMVGTDSTFVGDKPSPRTYGSFPRILGEFVRDEALLSLEEAVRKMTSAAADRLGLHDRGRLADGLAADVVVFDPARVRSLATYEEPRRFPEGIEHVVVNGTLVVEAGRHTRALPGRTLRPGNSPAGG